MKEAAGEANMTVITIILIGIISAVAYPMVNTLIKNPKQIVLIEEEHQKNAAQWLKD